MVQAPRRAAFSSRCFFFERFSQGMHCSMSISSRTCLRTGRFRRGSRLLSCQFLLGSVLPLSLSDRVSNHSFQLFRRRFSCVAQINLMVHSLTGYVQNISLGLHVCMHPGNRSGLIVIGTYVHALNAQPLIIGQELCFREVCLLFSCRFLDGPHSQCPGLRPATKNLPGEERRNRNSRRCDDLPFYSS